LEEFLKDTGMELEDLECMSAKPDTERKEAK